MERHCNRCISDFLALAVMPPRYRDSHDNDSIWSVLGPYFIVFFIGVCFVLFGYARSKILASPGSFSHIFVLAGPEYMEQEQEKMQKS